MRHLISTALSIGFALSLGAQTIDPLDFAKTIESKSIRDHVYKLASKEFQGREAGTEGNMKAANYIAEHFESYGIPVVPGDNNYFQEAAFSTVRWSDIGLTVNEKQYEHLKDFMSIPQHFPITEEPINIKSFTFLGYGIDDISYSDYQGKKFEGQHLLVYAGEPIDSKGNSRITGTDSISAWSSSVFLKFAAAKKAGAASLWIIDHNLREQVMFARRYLLTGAMLMTSPEKIEEEFIAHISVSPSLGQEIVGKKKNKVIKLRKRISQKGTPGSVVIPANVQLTATHQIKSTPGVNVLGFIEGSDPILKNEIVLVTAHFDHLGMRGKEIFYGADDNASGTAAVLEIAQAMAIAKAEGKGPRRSVLCMLVTGEEKGLLGSQYYVEHPVFPLDRIIADVNIDMIGRTDTLHKQPNYIYVIGSDRLSTELHEINEAVNSKYTHLELDYTYNRDDDPNRFYYRSDHYNFAKEGIPAIFYFSGVHEDYHMPTDTPEKLLYDKAETIARLAFHTAWELANRKERIRVNVVGRS